MKKKSKKSKGRILPLTPEELVRLEQFSQTTPDAMPMTRAHGLITAMASTPSPSLGPSAWMGKVQGDHEFETEEEAQEISLLFTRLYNQIVTDLNKGYFSGPEDPDDVRLWCQGYLQGSRLDDKWRDDEHGVALLLPMGVLAGEFDLTGGEDDKGNVIEDQSGHEEGYLEELPAQVLQIHQYWNTWRQKTLMPTITQAPKPEKKVKVGRNEKCPCGSGKKYKKCCGKAGA